MCIFENLLGEFETQISTFSYLGSFSEFWQFLLEVAIVLIFEFLLLKRKGRFAVHVSHFSFNIGLADFLSWPLLEISEVFFCL